MDVFLEVIHKGLVIGGGVAGMTAALNLADQGFEVFLVEKSNKLGGFANNIYQTLENDDVQEFIQNLIEKINAHKYVNVYLDVEINIINGYIGNFTTDITYGKSKEKTFV